MDQWFTLDDSCVEVEGEGMNLQLLLEQTSFEEEKAIKRATALVDSFLDRVATNEVVKV